jgi:hypothetical protein
VSGGSGSVGNANITGVQIACTTNTYTIGGTVSGLSGTGLVLQDNGGNDLALAPGATSFTFAMPVASGGSYSVTVMSQPSSPAETCAVSGGSGPVANANISSVQVACTTNIYTIGGTVAGLTGTGLVLQDNDGNNLALAPGATSFAFTTPVASGGSYSVTVMSQPSNPSEACAVSGGSGPVANANITSVQIACTTNTYTIGGTVAGLTGTGLVLQDNSGNNLALAPGATSFAFTAPISSGGSYSVTVMSQPSSPSQACAVSGGSGPVGNANITSVEIACITNTYTIGGTVSGLTGTGLVLQDNGGDNLALAFGATSFTFATPVASGASYNVTISSQPSSPSQTCSVTAGAGSITNANITSIQIICTAGTYSIGGTVSGLNGAGLVLENTSNGSFLMVNRSGNFVFAVPVASGSPYDVTISVQPSNPAQTCTVTNGSGTANFNVTAVLVVCAQGAWAWMKGSSGVNQFGAYGTPGSAAPANTPGARQYAATWTDSVGNLWLFGGYGYDSTGTIAALNDLWEYTGGSWIWQGGSNLAGQSGNYGAINVVNPGNMPGARYGAVSWTDLSGNFWLFGGYGLDSRGTEGWLNDVWEYGSGRWTWMGGSDGANQNGAYGMSGVASANNLPGGRAFAAAGTDSAGNLWLFGGVGYDSSSPGLGELNDLWEYSGGEWTWVSGSATANQLGAYGQQGVSAPGNVPGARIPAAGWVDASGNFWLFGGASIAGDLNDLWECSGGAWTWVSGSDTHDQPGVYGILGLPSPTNVPGARQYALAWVDSSGARWLFGGYGSDSTGAIGYLDDLWKYDAGQWTWVSGTGVANPNGNYGTAGIFASSNLPGGRFFSTRWIDPHNNLWLFGGYGEASPAADLGNMNDLWIFVP